MFKKSFKTSFKAIAVALMMGLLSVSHSMAQSKGKEIVIKAGTVPVSDIKTAEAVKVVENSQRDINIAFMNRWIHHQGQGDTMPKAFNIRQTRLHSY